MILVITRKGLTHITKKHRTHNSGVYYTMCGKILFSNKSKLKILAVNNSIDGICHLCKKNQIMSEKQYYDFMKYKSCSFNDDFLYCHINEIIGPKDKFEAIFYNRHVLLSKYRYLVYRKGIYE